MTNEQLVVRHSENNVCRQRKRITNNHLTGCSSILSKSCDQVHISLKPSRLEHFATANDHPRGVSCNAVFPYTDTKHLSTKFGPILVWPCKLLFVSAPKFTGSCTVVSSNATSISFTWSSAPSAVVATYNLTNGTTASALYSGDQTSTTIGGLAFGTNYSFSLYAWTRGQNTTSQPIPCSGWTGELLILL